MNKRVAPPNDAAGGEAVLGPVDTNQLQQLHAVINQRLNLFMRLNQLTTGTKPFF
jgi:hypothetical protein